MGLPSPLHQQKVQKATRGDKGDSGDAGPAGEDGDNAIFFLQPVVEVPVAADGVSITEAVFFDPNPTIVVLTRVNEDGTTTDLNVTLEISATGVYRNARQHN